MGTEPGVASVARVSAQFDRVPGYLDVASVGLPSRGGVEAIRDLIERWRAGGVRGRDMDLVVASARESFARIAGTSDADVAIGASTSSFVGMVAASVPEGATVVVVEDDFTSVTYPFLQQAHRGVTVRPVPLHRLPDEVARGCDAVAFALVASRTGLIADLDGVVTAARDVGALTVADLSQAAGWLPVAAGDVDVTVTSAYKWLGAPRGVAFLTATAEARERLTPWHAGWYASQDPWSGIYGVAPDLAVDARRFDISPAWLPIAGAESTLALFAAADIGAVRAYDVGLADAFRSALGLSAAGRPVVTLPDPEGGLAQALGRGGCTVSSRAGAVRLSFHVWNTIDDVERALLALSGEPIRRDEAS